MVLTFISIPALPLYDRVLNHTGFIASGGGNGRVYLGALFEILTLIGGIGMAVTLFPVLKRQSESLALGYVTVRVVESCLIAVGIVSLLAVVTLRQDLAGAGGTDTASLVLSGRSLVAIHDATFLLGPAFCAAIGNGLILGFLMLRSGLVPRRLAQLGLVGGSLALITALLVLFGAYDQTSAASFFLTLPEAVWELSLGIYLVARGFKVDLSYRKAELSRMNQINVKDIEGMAGAGRLELLMPTDVERLEAAEGRPRVVFKQVEPRVYDHVVYALGGTTPAGFLQATGIELKGGEPILREGGETSVPGLFLAGDLTAGKKGGSIISAFNSGVAAMRVICRDYLDCPIPPRPRQA